MAIDTSDISPTVSGIVPSLPPMPAVPATVPPVTPPPSTPSTKSNKATDSEIATKSDATVVGFTPNQDGTYTWNYSDGTKQTTPNSINPSTGLPLGQSAATPTAPTTPNAGVSSAFDDFRSKFQSIGLGSLADTLLSLSISPNAPTTSSGYYAALLQTPEYKTRFGDTNAMRLKNGLPMLSEGQILTAEQNITNTLRTAGLPAGFYDQPQDLQQFIALDKSAAEVGDIISAYQDMAKQVDPNTLNALQTYYGVDMGGVTAALMDPAKAQPVLNALTQKGTTAAAAASGGFGDITGAAQVANTMGAGSLSYAKQAQAFAQAQQLGQQAGTLSNIYGNAYGGTYTTGQGLQEALGGPEAIQAQQLRQRLTTQEMSAFGGSAGASTQGQSLGIGNAQGVS